MDVVRALLYLRVTSLANALRGHLRRLRQPKYLLGAAAAAAYIWFFFLRKGPGSGGMAFAKVLAGGGVEYLAAGVLSLFVFLIWLTPGDQPGLPFTEAEVAFLFPAPLSRSQLIHYKLVDGLVVTLFGALFFTLISASVRDPLTLLRHLGAWWALNACLSLHQTAAALTITRLSQIGFDAPLRRWVLGGAALVVVILVPFLAINAGPATVDWLLWPARLVVRPFIATTVIGYLLALGPAALLVAAHYVWIHRLETPFEEASIARARKTAESVERLRAGKAFSLGARLRAKREPFRLADRLPPEAGLLWKNLMAAPAWLNRRTFAVTACLIVVGVKLLQSQPGYGMKLATVAGFLSFVLLIYLLIFGPQLARNDLRGDLLNADILKAWPLPGWRLTLGSLLAPTVHLTAIAWLILLVAGLSLAPPSGKAPPWFTPELRVAGALALALVMPFLCAVQLLVPNAGALIFPAWAQNSRNMAGGIDVMGQRLIFFAGQFVCLLVALLPAVALGGLTIFLTQWLLGLPAAVLLAAVPVVIVFTFELCLGVWLVGPRFDRLDISAELRP